MTSKWHRSITVPSELFDEIGTTGLLSSQIIMNIIYYINGKYYWLDGCKVETVKWTVKTTIFNPINRHSFVIVNISIGNGFIKRPIERIQVDAVIDSGYELTAEDLLDRKWRSIVSVRPIRHVTSTDRKRTPRPMCPIWTSAPY